MNNKLIFSILVIAIALFSSCKKDRDTPTPEPSPSTPSVPDYAVLKIGNYWVYNTYFTDQMGYVSLTEDYDSAYIEKDTMIAGKTYFKKVVVSRLFPSVSFWREENGKLIDNNGKTFPDKEGKLSTQVYYSSSTDTAGIQTSYLLGGETSISVPAGVYTVKTIEHVFENYIGPPSNRKILIQRWYTKYHPTKGEIYRSYGYAGSAPNSNYEIVLVGTNVD